MIEKMLFYIALLSSAFFLFQYLIAGRLQSYEAKSRLGIGTSKKIPQAPLFNLVSPIIGLVSDEFGSRLKKISWSGYRTWVDRQLIFSGLDEKLTVEDFWIFQGVMAILLPLLTSFVAFGPTSLTLTFLLGLSYPCLWTRGLIKKRLGEIRLALAPAVDLISISVEAGLDFIAAISRFVERSAPGALVDEFKRMVHEIKMGSTREQALRALAGRVDDMSISSFAAVLIQADRLGTSIGPALKAQADKLRTDRFQLAERKGAAASQKILFPLVFFIIPAVFIVIFAPIALQFLSGGMGGVFK